MDEFGWAEGPQGSRFPAQRERGGAVALPLTNRREGVDRDQAFGVSSVTSRIEGRASARGAAVPGVGFEQPADAAAMATISSAAVLGITLGL